MDLTIDKLCTLDDYYALPDDSRVELIRGYFYDMAGASARHQTLAGGIYRSIANYIERKGGDCKVLFAPFDVHIQKKDKEHNYDSIVQPDVMVICDKDKIKENRCEGAPDWIIEIVSKSNSDRDYFDKLSLYRECGVREYWIVDPIYERILVYYFGNPDEPHDPVTIYGINDRVKVNIYEDLEIDFSQINE